MTAPRPLCATIARFLTLALALAVTACAGPSLPSRQAPDKITDAKNGYPLEAGNHVRVTVFNETTLSGEFTIDSSGTLAMPLIGSIPAAGITSATLAQRITDKIREENYLRDPRVSVESLSLRPVYVLGEVKGGGEFPYSEGMTVLSVIARAGGYDYRAAEGEVLLIRQENGRKVEYRAEEYTPLQPGDIIRVLERHF